MNKEEIIYKYLYRTCNAQWRATITNDIRKIAKEAGYKKDLTNLKDAISYAINQDEDAAEYLIVQWHIEL
jgi:uncharacterized protein YihD (DUF1040 family)